MPDVLTLRDIAKGYTSWEEQYESYHRETEPLLDALETERDELANFAQDMVGEFNWLHEDMRQHEAALLDCIETLTSIIESPPDHAGDPNLVLEEVDGVRAELENVRKGLAGCLGHYTTDYQSKLDGIERAER